MEKKQQRTVKIKTNSLKRTLKDYDLYIKEEKKEQERLEKFKTDKKDEYRLKQQRQVIEEAKAMIPFTKNRVISFTKDLKKFMGKEEELKENEEYLLAKKVLEEAEKVLANPEKDKKKEKKEVKEEKEEKTEKDKETK